LIFTSFTTMPNIRNLFDSTRALSRPIEKVITYQNRTDEQVRAEISEYVVTEHIEENFEDLLKRMQTAQQSGGGHEIGVWVSGFYGSGKSSFTKYLGFGLDREMMLGDTSFLQLLQNQLRTASTKALFNQVSNSYNAAVVFLDLASEMLAGASMEDISTVLYLKVLQWAGYSEDLKVAELERMLEKDGKLDAFRQRAKDELDGIDWIEVHNQPLVANQISARLATEFYPALFRTAAEFGDLTLHVNKSETKRAEEMIELIRQKSGKKNILFIIDEVGQYVSAKPNLILNLDGLAKNLKQIGGGSVWLFATAQQTLTEDNPTAALNSPGLFKLKDRFPIQLHLEASDIKEICHKRLLTKSAAGEQKLSNLFDSNVSLRTATQLSDAGVYQTELTKKSFVDLYPFLPAHFEILLQLLGRLAKKTGGLGLRSAIKVVQEVLIEHGHGQTPLADEPVGRLANTVTFYDSLRRDVLSSFAHVVEGVQRVEQRLPNDTLCHQVAKSIAVLQILENLPVTAANIAALMQPEVASPSLKDNVANAVDTMLKDGMIPLGEKNGSLRFLTLAAVTLQRQFDLIEYRNADVRNELNGVLRSTFKPLPSARLAGVRPVTAGLKVMLGGGQSISLEGEKEAIQLHVEFVPSSTYDSMRGDREIDSMSTKERTSIFLLGRSDTEADQLAVTLVRCRKFLDTHRATVDPETQEFVRIVDARLQRTTSDLERKLSAALYNGSFVAHGAHAAVSSNGPDVLEAAKNFLGDAAKKVFDRYSEAPTQADSGLAEKFLKTQLDRITSNEDPLGIITRAGGRAQVKTDHKALVSINDYLGQNGQVEGRRLLDHFSAPPFGWSKDTVRYLLAAGFLGGEIKLRIAGKDHQVKNDDSLAAFTSNKSIGPVGIALREEPPDPEACLRACERLQNLSGDTIMPLEDEIAAAAKKHFPSYQAAFGPLAVELRSLHLTPEEHSDRLDNLASDLAEILSGDASDTVKRLGSLDSPLYESLVWARKLKKALDHGLRQQLSHIRQLHQDLSGLPDSGPPAKLKDASSDALLTINEILSRESFFDDTSSLGTAALEIDKLVSQTVTDLAKQQTDLALTELGRWQSSPDWKDLQEEDRTSISNQTAELATEATKDLAGLRKLLNHDFELNHRLRDLGDQVAESASKHRAARDAAAKEKAKESGAGEPKAKEETLYLPLVLDSAQEIEALIKQLTTHLDAIKAGTSLHLKCHILDDGGGRAKHTYP
jgi:hypothetical protein